MRSLPKFGTVRFLVGCLTIEFALDSVANHFIAGGERSVYLDSN